MEMTQMNIRIPTHLKREGDLILQQRGTSPSAFIRLMWEYLVDHQDVPACAKRNSLPSEDILPQKAAAIQQASSLVPSFCKQVGIDLDGIIKQPLDYSSMREEQYREMLREYEAL